MYKCAVCGRTSEPRERCNLVAAERRQRTYVDEETGESRIGWEIVSEIKFCSQCFEKREAELAVKVASEAVK